jgi:hypothetical protein
MIFDWTDPPGEFYAVAYILSFTAMICNCPRRHRALPTAGIIAGFGLGLTVLMTVTHQIYRMPLIFAFLMLLYLGILWGMLAITCVFSAMASLYFSVRAFIAGEFVAAFSYQIYYYLVDYQLMPFSWPAAIGCNLTIDLLSTSIFYIWERRNRKMNGRVKITGKELTSVCLIGLAIYVTSNMSYVMEEMNISQIVIVQLIGVRTLVDLGGAAILFAYHSQLVELSGRYELMRLQDMLEMQYNNYEILKQSVDVVNQKYHDLKHQIALLKEGAAEGTSMAYLEQMEQDIKAYEATNKTGNNALDTILTAKTLYCQNNWIELTSVAEGEALSFMEPMDIAALFGNILDNAIESVSKIERKERRLIHLAVVKQKGFLRIRAENCYEEAPKVDEGEIVTSKKDRQYHGFGIKSIKSTVKKYGGSTTIQMKKGWFELRILIPIP